MNSWIPSDSMYVSLGFVNGSKPPMKIQYNQKFRNQYIREALDLEEKMLVEDDESVVTKIERECLAKQQTIIQSHYCPEVEELQECTPKQTQALEFLMTYRPGGNIKSAQNVR